MSFEKVAEQKIQEAMEQGEFDNLAGAGRPLKGLDSYFATPEDVQLGHSILKSAGFVPEEVALLREIESLKSDQRRATGSAEQNRLAGAVQRLQLKYDVLIDTYRRRRNRR